MLEDEEEFYFDWSPTIVRMQFFIPDGTSADPKFEEAEKLGLVLTSAKRGISYTFRRPDEKA